MSNIQSHLPLTLTTPEKLVITIKRGCITKEKVDVVINSTNETLDLDIGELSSSILQAAGNSIQDECRRDYPTGTSLNMGIVAKTSGGNMPARSIYHGALTAWLNGNGENDLIAYVRTFLDDAYMEGKTSMAIPAISTGILQFPPRTVAKIFHEEIFRFSKARPDTTLKDIRIMLIAEPQITEFTTYFQEILASGANPAPVATRPRLPSIGDGGLFMPHLPNFDLPRASGSGSDDEVIGDTDTPDADPPENQDIMIAIKTNERISVHIKIGNISNAKSDVIVNVTTKNLRLYHGAISKSIMRIAGKSIEKECHDNAPSGLDFGNIVKTSGGGLKCQAIYHGAIREWTTGFGEQDLRKLMQNVLDLADIDGFASIAMPSIGTGQVLGFPPATVAKCMLEEIETFGALNGPTSVSLVEIVLYEKDARVLADFQSYMSAKYKVKCIPLPASWSVMPPNQPFKMDTLDPNSAEYKRVSARFVAKGGPNNIRKVERMQCPNMYQLFAVRKQQVDLTVSDRTKFKVERTLYHGTSRDVLESINTLGFNRSFCGKNAVSIGFGTYFAKQAAYSCRDAYSPPDRKGNKYVYQCRVVTGEYTLGQHGYRQPPPKQADIPSVLYDSVADNIGNPKVFVVFYDAQAYPEYLITFRK